MENLPDFKYPVTKAILDPSGLLILRSEFPGPALMLRLSPSLL